MPPYRYNPKLAVENKNPFQLDSHDPKIPLEDYIYTEGRYRILQQSDREVAKFLLAQAQKFEHRCWQQYKQLAETKIRVMNGESALTLTTNKSGLAWKNPIRRFIFATSSRSAK